MDALHTATDADEVPSHGRRGSAEDSGRRREIDVAPQPHDPIAWHIRLPQAKTILQKPTPRAETPQRRLSLAVARISLSLTGEALSRRWRLGFWNMASTAEGPSPSFICARKSQRIPRVRDEGCCANSGERPGSRCFYRELEDDPGVWGLPGGEWSGTHGCCLKGPTRR